MQPVRWGATLGIAAAATVFAALLCLSDVRSSEEHIGWLVVTGPEDNPAQLIEADGLRGGIAQGGRHDGAYFYVIARNLWSLDDVAPHLDSPHYRLQRILYPALAHALHPSPGNGLVWTMFGIGLAGIFLCAAATSALSQVLRGPVWPGIVLGLLPGAYVSLRISVPDPLALAFVLWAIFFSVRQQWTPAVVAGVLAVLTRESSWLLLAGFAVWRRDRQAVPLVAVPAFVAAAWYVLLKVVVDIQGEGISAMAMPFTGWVESFRFWGRGHEAAGMFAALTGLLAALVALGKRGLRHPLGWAIALQLGLTLILIGSAIAPGRSAGRTFLPVLVLAIVALVTPTADRTLFASSPGEPADALGDS